MVSIVFCIHKQRSSQLCCSGSSQGGLKQSKNRRTSQVKKWLICLNSKSMPPLSKAMPLFVFLIGSCEQNGVSLLTPVSDSVFIALSDGTFLFSLHGSFKNHQHKALWLAVGIVSTNQVMVKWATIQSKMNGTIWKSIENLIRNWCQKFHTILLRVISLKNKQWRSNALLVGKTKLCKSCGCKIWI